MGRLWRRSRPLRNWPTQKSTTGATPTCCTWDCHSVRASTIRWWWTWSKRTGRGLTMDMSYTWSRQEGDSFSSQQGGQRLLHRCSGFQQHASRRHTPVTGYDLAHVVKGFVSYELPVWQGTAMVGKAKNHVVNGIVSGWTITGLVKYTLGAPFDVGAANPYWPLWGRHLSTVQSGRIHGPQQSQTLRADTGGSDDRPGAGCLHPAERREQSAAGVLPPSPALPPCDVPDRPTKMPAC